MPAKRVETSRTTVTSRIHTAFLSLGMHIIRDVAENGPTIENLGRYYAMSAMRDALSVAIDGGLERLRFEPTKRMKFDRYARVVRTGKPPRPGEEYDEEKA